jgi:hypothetical protein
MYTINLTIRNTPFPVSVERKTEDDAEALYQQILKAMQTGEPPIVELTSEGKTEKKIALRASEISGLQLSQKDGTAATGRPPGFFAMTE